MAKTPKTEKVKNFEVDTKKVMSKNADFVFYKNVQRPHENYYFKESTKEVCNDKNEIVGTGHILNGIVLVIKFNPR